MSAWKPPQVMMLSWIRKFGVQVASWKLAAAPIGPLYRWGAICA
jgi:hypothetical protein